MNFEEIKTALTELQNQDDFLYNLASKIQPHRDLFGEIALVYEQGDTEGGGEYSCKVFEFKDHGVFVKIEGFYSSYEGTEWEYNWKEVTPKEKMITVYE